MKLLFTISAVIVLRSGASKCVAGPRPTPPTDAICQTPLGDGQNCTGGFLKDNVWYDGYGCNPLKKEVFCHNTNCCVVYEASGAHCKEDDLPTATAKGVLTEGGFHPYPDCGSLDNDREWGGYDENDIRFNATGANVVADEIDSNSPGYANDDSKDKAKWLNNTNFVPGWYWCQAKLTCLHPQIAWNGTRQIDMSKLDKRHAQKCEAAETGGNWKDHIFEAPEVGLFYSPTATPVPGDCADPDTDTAEYAAIGFPAGYKHCTIYQLPVGNSYSGKSKTQCASGKVDRCDGAVAFYFSIAGFGHNYNFNFCLSTTGTDGNRTNAWNNGL